MQAYRKIFLNTISIGLIYRGSVLIAASTRLLETLTTIFIWQSIFNQTPVVGGYTRTSMISYLLLTSLLGFLFSSSHFFRLPPLVRKGTLSCYLVRPYSFLGDSFAVFLGDKVIEMVLIGVIALVFWLVGLPFFSAPQPLAWVLLLSNFVLSFAFGSVIGTLSFWIVEMWPFKPLYASFMALFSGALFPLDILPAPIAHFLQYTPFSLFGFVNTRALQGAFSSEQLLRLLEISLAWNIVCFSLYTLLWRRGLKQYEAVSG
jgi:ABC-2 type transport system permease protein